MSKTSWGEMCLFNVKDGFLGTSRRRRSTAPVSATCALPHVSTHIVHSATSPCVGVRLLADCRGSGSWVQAGPAHSSRLQQPVPV